MKIENNALYLLDGYSLIYRSYFAFINRPLFNSKGVNTSAVFGFFRQISSLLENHNPEYFCVVLDSATPTFRHKMYPEYKANREKAPEDLHAQVPIIQEVLKAMNIKSVRLNGYEADDIIAHFSEQCKKESRECFIITGDKDLLQLVGNGVKIMKPDKGSYQILDVDDVTDVWGVSPKQIIDYLALTGDSADNIPGVKGIGPKTAVKLLSDYKTLDGIYQNIEKHTGSIRKKLEENKKNAFLSHKLVTLETNLNTGVSVKDFSCAGLDKAAGATILRREEVNSIADRLEGDNEPKESVTTDFTQKTFIPEKSIVYDGVTGLGKKYNITNEKGLYETVTTEKALESWIKRVKDSVVFAFDSETTDVDSMKAIPLGFSLSTAAQNGCYISLKDFESGTEFVKNALKDILEDENLKLVGQNIKYDYKVLKRWGIEIKNIMFDTMIAAWILDSNIGKYNMDMLAERVLNYTTIHYKDIVAKGNGFETVPLDLATEYAAEDADITFRLYKAFYPELQARGKLELFNDIELPLVTVLAQMELEGIRLNPRLLDSFGKEVDIQLDKIEKDIYSLCDEEFNINSTKQLQKILFEKRGLKPVKKTKTGYSTNVQTLEILAFQDPVPEKILEHRSLSKLKTTYIDTLPLLINEVTGRIHTSLIQTGTATGRLSSKDPNLQNIPIKTKNGRRIRAAFIPAAGCKFLSADYSQIELVVLAHLSGDKGLKNAFLSGQDVHKQTASMIFDVFPEMVTPEQRRIAKTINFGVMYGMSAFRLSRELKIQRKQADKFIGAYFNRYSGIKAYIESNTNKAQSSGTVTTIMGHERYIHGINSRNATERSGAERIALNTPIQGSAADIVKMAMLKISRKISANNLKSKLILQVHDELIFEVPEEEIEIMINLVKKTMETVVELSIPINVSIETGNCWGEMH